MKGKVHFIQLGCDKNRVDGEVMLGLLDEAGYEITPDADRADAIIVNTCGFISEAVQESIETVLEASAYKTDGVCKALIVAGCMATRYKDEILNEIPETDAVLAAAEYREIVPTLDKVLAAEYGETVPISDMLLTAEYGEAVPVSDAPLAAEVGAKAEPLKNKPALDSGGNRNTLRGSFTVVNGGEWNALRLAGRKMTAMPHIAYVKIAEGCDNSCTYCTIPSIRGAYVERPPELILDECRQLIADGAKELVFVAQDTAKHSHIAELIRTVSKLDGLTWLRLMYAYPEHITDELIEAVASGEKVCPYIDMPVQHASDTVLKRMGRKSSRKELVETVNRLRDKIPGVALRTTLMVGFPGETETEFDALCDFVREIRFDRLGVFVYSPEDGTPAARMKGKVKKSEANARRDKLMLIQQEIHREKQQALVGQTADVMVDSITAEQYGGGLIIGRTVSDAVEVDAVVSVSLNLDRTPVPGEIIKVHITGASDYDLTGEMI